MLIVVLIKAARRDPEALERLPALAPCDGAALAWALHLGHSNPAAEVVALTAGPESSDPALERALDLGVHRAVRVWVPDADVDLLDRNVRGIAELLTATLRHLGPFDLVLTGARSADWSSGITGPAVAFGLELPHATQLTELAFAPISEGSAGTAPPLLRAQQLRGAERLHLEIQLPAVLTVCASAPSLATAARREGARIETLTNDDVGFEVDDPLPWPPLPVERASGASRKLTDVHALRALVAPAGPGSARPGSARPGSAGPGSAGPGSAGPGSAGPGSAGPGSAGPGSAGPGSAGPGSGDATP